MVSGTQCPSVSVCGDIVWWSGIKWCWEFFPIRVGFNGLCRWVECDKIVLGLFSHQGGFQMMDCGDEMMVAAVAPKGPKTYALQMTFDHSKRALLVLN